MPQSAYLGESIVAMASKCCRVQSPRLLHFFGPEPWLLQCRSSIGSCVFASTSPLLLVHSTGRNHSFERLFSAMASCNSPSLPWMRGIVELFQPGKPLLLLWKTVPTKKMRTSTSNATGRIIHSHRTCTNVSVVQAMPSANRSIEVELVSVVFHVDESLGRPYMRSILVMAAATAAIVLFSPPIF